MARPARAGGRPLTPHGQIDQVALNIVEARGRIAAAVDELTEAYRAVGRADVALRVVREHASAPLPEAA